MRIYIYIAAINFVQRVLRQGRGLLVAREQWATPFLARNEEGARKVEEKPGWPGFRGARRPSCSARPIRRLETLKQPYAPPRLHPPAFHARPRINSVPQPPLRRPGKSIPLFSGGGRERLETRSSKSSPTNNNVLSFVKNSLLFDYPSHRDFRIPITNFRISRYFSFLFRSIAGLSYQMILEFQHFRIFVSQERGIWR